MKQKQTNQSARRLRHGLAASAAAIVIFSGGVMAIGPENAEKNVLKGPRVQQTGSPERGGEGRAQRAEQDRQPRLMAFMMAIRSLQRADESLHLTEAQQQQLKTISDEHKAEMAVFMEANKEEIQELRQQAGLPEQDRSQQQERQRGQRGERVRPENEMDAPQRNGQRQRPSEDGTTGNRARPERDAQPTPEQKAARDQLRVLMEGAPSDQASIKQATTVLSAEQQAHVKEAIAKGRERMSQRRGGAESGTQEGRRRNADRSKERRNADD